MSKLIVLATLATAHAYTWSLHHERPRLHALPTSLRNAGGSVRQFALQRHPSHAAVVSSRSRPVVCVDVVPVACELAGGAGVIYILLRKLNDYLTYVFVGPRPRGGTSAAEASELERLAYMAPREEPWTVDELRRFDGTGDDEKGPILLAADGLVFNVGKARKFYGPGCEYHIMAGRDASRLLGKTLTEEESEEERKRPLSIAEQAVLSAWVFSFKQKYAVVGVLRREDE